MTTYALLVGIDAYEPPANPLFGCRNDIAALGAYLEGRSDGDLDVQTLLDGEATRDAVVGAFRAHLGRAAAGDVALFAYAGHGSEEPAPTEIAHLEPTGRIQTLMFHDCNRRVDGRLRRALADKELSLLLAEVAANGPHVVVILDCCHSGGGTRDPFVRTRGWIPDVDNVEPGWRDLVAEVATPRPSTEFVPGSLASWNAPRPPHVALAACRSYETAKEHRVGEATRGAFSVALVDALDALGTRTTYRSLLTTVRARVERTAQDQRPELFPLDPGGLADALFLDGAVQPVAASFTVSRGLDGWEVDAGIVHGLRDPVGDEAFVLACTAPGGAPAGAVRVTAVDVGRSSVEPIGWEPDDVAYAAVVADVPLPPAEVQLDPWVAPEPGDPRPGATAADVAAVHDAVVAAIASAGPHDTPSPYVRAVDPSTGSAGAVRLRVAVPEAGIVEIRRADGSLIASPLSGVGVTEGAARLVVAHLEHIARWEQVRSLGDHPSPVADAVTLDVYEAMEGETRRPSDRPALVADGGYQLTYHRGVDGLWQPPRVFVELRNESEDDLYVAVLDLTDRFRCHAVLPTELVGHGRSYALWSGAPIPASLPAGRPVAPGAAARDWLKVVVSDVDFDATSFDLAALDEPSARGPSTRGAPRNTLERIAARAHRRDFAAADPAPPVARWAATTITIDTRVPT